jgi:hypothetical protein
MAFHHTAMALTGWAKEKNQFFKTVFLIYLDKFNNLKPVNL